ncbi:hypothetical protein OKJ48_30890 [Streptomyces kunmingensis]|uniref:PQQ-like domain-containing protein n=1 Tax=Streptomyces kunmingensis TaxID=68225 RepID=A0ABU6CIQ9_9ACTN|nr:hypothetical protein [Streptomyces kunmingensis]MEB3964604.1 hypothetical protein [Streptomyces kunmingensis]
MAVEPLDAATEAGPAQRTARPPLPPPGHAPGRPRRTLRLALAAALLAVPLLIAAHHARPAPYGDHLTRYARVAADSGEGAVRLRTRGAAVEAYDTSVRWRHTREGSRPLAVLAVSGQAFALWSDGMVTDTEGAEGRAVRWHRAIPDAAAWLRTPGARDGAGVLQPLDDSGTRMLAVVTPRRIAAYRTVDGDLRWVLPARAGCAFVPAAYLRRGSALLIAQPCTDATVAWSERIVAVDGLGRIVPRRAPLGNELSGRVRPDAVGKSFASHR